MAQWIQRSRHTEVDEKRQASLDRLRSSKSQVSGELDRQRANTSFEIPDPATSEVPMANQPSGLDRFGSETSRQIGPSAPSAPPSMQTDDEQSYTSRLLEAKRQAKKKQ
jgi:hypothetical protein